MRLLSVLFAAGCVAASPSIDSVEYAPQIGNVLAPPGEALQLSVTAPVIGDQVYITVRNADPGEAIWLARGTEIGEGACHAALGGACLDVAGNLALQRILVADATGEATVPIGLPLSTPIGSQFAFQAIAARSGTDAVLSNPVEMTTMESLVEWTLTNNDTCDMHGAPIRANPTQIDELLVTRLDPPGTPFNVESISYSLDDSLPFCNAELAHWVYVFVDTDLVPDVNATPVDMLYVPSTTVTAATREVTMALNSVVQVQDGEHLFIAVQMESGGFMDDLCLNTCTDDTTPEATYWSGGSSPPFGWSPLPSPYGDLVVNASGTVSAFDIEWVCDDGFDDNGDGLVDCDDPACAGTPECFTCLVPDVDLGSLLGEEILVDDNTGAPQLHNPSCSTSLHQRAVRWVAPTDGVYVFDTNDSLLMDTTLTITDACGTQELACDDDSGPDLLSSITTTLVAGEEIMILVGGFSTQQGEFNLSIERL